MIRIFRSVAILVLFFSAIQIGMCVVDCDCFFTSANRMSAHQSSRGDADGCICCAQSAELRVSVEIPSPLPEGLAFFNCAPRPPRRYAVVIDLPPRS